jgi:hypothetical protein
MENQHRKIAGYRELSEAEVALMNQIKAKGLELDALLVEIRGHIQSQYEEARNPNANADTERDRLDHAEPHRWLAVARTDFQTGLMALVRAVAQPGNF